MKFTIDIDTGGTFTDGFFTTDGQVRKIKVDTTPHDLTVCFSTCIEEGAKSFGVSLPEMLSNTEVVRFASTIGSNTMITRSGPKIGLVVTQGFEDSLYGRGEHGESLFDFILSPAMVQGIGEEVDAAGKVKKAPGENEVKAVTKQLLQRGARMIVVSLLGATRNGSNEKRVREIVSATYPSHFLGAVPLLLSSEVSASASDVLRTNTAVVNAYLHQAMARFLYKADDYLRKNGYPKPMLVAHCGGGTARVAKTTAVQTWGAGPAAGLAGAASIGRLYGIKHAVLVDVGGTTTDIGLVSNGSYSYSYHPEIEGVKSQPAHHRTAQHPRRRQLHHRSERARQGNPGRSGERRRSTWAGRIRARRHGTHGYRRMLGSGLLRPGLLPRWQEEGQCGKGEGGHSR